MTQIILLGEHDQLHEFLVDSCQKIAPTSLLSYAQCGGIKNANQTQDAICFVLSICTNWEITQLKSLKNFNDQPIFAVATLTNGRLLDQYLKLGFQGYYSIAHFNRHVKDIIVRTTPALG